MPAQIHSSLLWSKYYELANRRRTPQGVDLPRPLVEAHRVLFWPDTQTIGIRLHEMVVPGSLRLFEAEAHAGPGGDPYRRKQTALGSDIEYAEGNVEAGPDSGEFVERILNRPPLGLAGDSLVQVHALKLGQIVLAEYQGMGAALQTSSAFFTLFGPGHILWLDFSIFPEPLRADLMDRELARYRSVGYILWNGESPEEQGVDNPYGLTLADLGNVMGAELYLRARQLEHMGVVRADSLLEHSHNVSSTAGAISGADLQTALSVLVDLEERPGAFGMMRTVISTHNVSSNDASIPVYARGTTPIAPRPPFVPEAWDGGWFRASSIPVQGQSVSLGGATPADRANAAEVRVKERAVVVMVKIR